MTSPAATSLPPLPPRPRWFRLRKWVIRGFWTSVCLSMVFVLWSLWYVNDRGFTKKWRRMLSKELEQQGIHAEIGRLTLNPLRGLVAKNIKIIDPQDRDRMLANINEVVLDINYSNLVHGLSFVNAFDLRDARLSLPLDPSDRKSERLEVSGLNARVLLPPHQLYIAQAEANVHGLRVTAKGRLINYESFKPEKSDKKSEEIQPRDVLRWINSLEITGETPHLELQFDGDLSVPSQLFVEGVFRSGEFSIDGKPLIRSAQIVATYSEGVVRLRQCNVIGVQGELSAAGAYHPSNKEATFQLRSTLDLPTLAAALRLMEERQPYTFATPPLLEVQGEALFRSEAEGGIRTNLQGHFEVGRFNAGKIRYEGATADFSWDGDRWFVRNARLSHASGTLELTAMNVPGDFRFQVESRIDPAMLLPFLPEKAEKILSEWDFQNAPLIRLEGRAPGFEWEAVEAQGLISLGRTRFRKIGLVSLVAPIDFREKILTVRDFKIERTEGRGSGTFVLDFPERVVRLVGARSTMHPVDVATWIDYRGILPRALMPYKFKPHPPNLTVEGTVELGKDDKTLLRIGVIGEGLDYVFLGKHLPVPQVTATLWIDKNRLRIEDLDGTLYGGKISGDANISLERDQGDYTAHIKAANVDFPSLTKLYFDYDTSKGKLQGEYKFSGKGEVARNIRGVGQVTVTDGNVFAIPLLGPFSGILNEIIPGTGFNQARKASATFEMKDGIIETGDLLVEGKGFSMMGGGKLFVLEDKIDFSIRINAQGAAGMILSPVSHLFEYVSDQSLAKPVWRPKRLPKGFFKQQGQ